MEPTYQSDSRLEDFKSRVLERTKKIGPAIIIGPLGSGKTRNVKELLAQVPSCEKVEWVEFMSSKSVEEALLKSIPLWIRLAITLVGFAVFLLIPFFFQKWFPDFVAALSDALIVSPGEAYIMLVGFGSFALLINKTNFLFHFASWLPCNQPSILVLDDLDRSSLSIDDVFNVIKEFSKIRRVPTIINLGYSSAETKYEILDFAYKLNAHVEELPISATVNINIAKFLDPVFPFSNSPPPEFIKLFTPREIFDLIERVKKIPQANEQLNIGKLLFLRFTVLELFRKFGYGAEKRSNISFMDNHYTLMIRPASTVQGFQIPKEEQEIFNSICRTFELKFKAIQESHRGLIFLMREDLNIEQIRYTAEHCIS